MDSPTARWIRSVVVDHERPLFLYARRLLGDVERARDVVQETFLRLCRQERDDLEPRLVEWLFTVCRHLAIDTLRKEDRMQPLTSDQREPASAGPAPDAASEQRESAAQIVALLATLPPNQREVLRLKFQHGCSYLEISRITGLTQGNVGFLIHTGIRTLRQRLAAAGKTAERPACTSTPTTPA